MCKRRHIAVLLFSSFRASCCNDADDAETVIITTLVGSPGTLALQFKLVIVVIVVIKQLQLSFS